jgi:hypothetical protein
VVLLPPAGSLTGRDLDMPGKDGQGAFLPHHQSIKEVIKNVPVFFNVINWERQVEAASYLFANGCVGFLPEAIVRG